VLVLAIIRARPSAPAVYGVLPFARHEEAAMELNQIGTQINELTERCAALRRYL
jgi:hypothetical protein